MTTLPVTPRTTLKRAAQRGSHNLETLHAILDEGMVCQISFVHDGAACLIPTLYARLGDSILIHGSTANRMMRAIRDGAPACVSVTLIDGLVFARSAFHHSMNYRSVVMYATAEEVTEPGEKQAALRAFLDHSMPGRFDDVRPPNREETLRTMVLRFPITEASAKIRTGLPIDDEEDYALDVWAGVLPLRLEAGKPIDDERLRDGNSVPHYVSSWRRDVRESVKDR